jgi:hypothetical protein
MQNVPGIGLPAILLASAQTFSAKASGWRDAGRGSVAVDRTDNQIRLNKRRAPGCIE